MQNHQDILEKIYNKAWESITENDFHVSIPDKISQTEALYLKNITDNSESFVGVLSVLITSLTEKIINPYQDVRKHQKNMEDGYSGRTLDTKTITPFLKGKKLKSPQESGWLTRSLEQPYSYTLNYQGKIRNKEVKNSFLNLLHNIEENGANPEYYLLLLFQYLIIQREQNKIEINKIENPEKYTISYILKCLNRHFKESFEVGTARLPVLAIYSVYQCMSEEFKRFEGMTLQPLGSHTSADLRSGDIGDIQINDNEGNPFEGVEIKYDMPITDLMVRGSFEKFKQYKTDRYYLLSTKDSPDDESEKIAKTILEIKKLHGCQVIVNGLIPTLKYYLRTLISTEGFLDRYTNNLLNDKVIKTEHKRLWKQILEND